MNYEEIIDEIIDMYNNDFDVVNIFETDNGFYIEFDNNKFLFVPIHIINNGDKKGGNILTNLIDIFKNGPIRKNAPPAFRKLLETSGNVPITTITICKEPIQKKLDSILNIISMGSWNQAKDDLSYDDMFHLFMILEMADNSIIRLEKNQVLSIAYVPDYKPNENTKCINIENYKKYSMTINKMMDNAINKYGNDRIYLYDGAFNNCQRFLSDLLLASGIIHPTKQFEASEPTEVGFVPTISFGTIGNKNEDDIVYEFINQDVITLFNKMPQLTRFISKGVTDIGGIFDKVLYGSSKNKNKINNKMAYNNNII